MNGPPSVGSGLWSTRTRLMLATAAVVLVLGIGIERYASTRVLEHIHAGEGDLAVVELRRALGLGMAAAIAAGLVVSAIAAHFLTRRIRVLTRTALAMSGGDLSQRAPAAGPDHLGQLGVALNRMASELSHSIEEIRDDRDLLASILDGMGEGVLVTNGANEIVLANRALRAMGVVAESTVGKRIADSIKPPALLALLEEGLASSESVVREVEVGRVVLKRLLVRVSRLPGDDGGLVVVFHDVTDLRRLETIRTDFVANVSHELRTPVTAIGTAAETLLLGALDQPAEALEFVELIERNAQRLRQLVDDLLDLSKIEAKNFRIQVTEVELWPVVNHAVQLLQESARRRKVQVAVVPEGVDLKTLRAFADRRAVEQVISNLIDNALKYGGEGARVEVRVRSVHSGDPVEISVSDNGPGIAPIHLGRIFERFYRVDAGRSRELGGTGLGLAIVKHLVELMGGSIHVDSELGKGSTFTVKLPRTAVAKPSEPRLDPKLLESPATSPESLDFSPSSAAVA
jgi:two-component system phosphate regulon sensor histidine kinase PhoR